MQGMWRFHRWPVLAGLLLLLASCAALEKPVPASSALQSKLAALPHWRLDGRIAVRTADDAFQASLFWEHERGQERVRVSGPFSQGVVSIILQDDLIFIRDSEGKTTSSRNPAALLREELGFAVPLPSLRYWILGVAEPSGPKADALYSETGQLHQLRQGGWVLDYQAFVPVQQFMLPQKLAAQGADIKLKVFVDEWAIVP